MYLVILLSIQLQNFVLPVIAAGIDVNNVSIWLALYNFCIKANKLFWALPKGGGFQIYVDGIREIMQKQNMVLTHFEGLIEIIKGFQYY